MKLFSLLFLLSVFYTYADNNIRINFKLYNSAAPSKLFELGFGINELAGDSVDTHLGEKSFPPFPPAFDAGLEYVDSTNFNQDGSKYYDLIRTNLDLRSVPSDIKRFHNRHKLVMNWVSGPTVVLEWNNTMFPESVDSIMIRDILGGIVINQDMKKTNKLTLDNDAIDKLYFDIYYNLNTTSIDELSKSDILVYPNPFNDKLFLENNIEFDDVLLYDLNGNLAFESKKLENIHDLLSGTYLLVLKLNSKIIKRQIVTKY